MENEKLNYEIDLGFIIVSVEQLKVYNVRAFPTHVEDYYFHYTAKVIYDNHTFSGIGLSETEALQNLSTKIKLAKELNLKP